jgi:hypothetical protein
MDMDDLFGEPIHTYSRAQALEDGVLVDVTEWASAEKGFIGGFKAPVALTAALWGTIERIPKRLEKIEDVRGRAHDVLWMASLAARRSGTEDQTSFEVLMSLPEGKRKLRLWMVAGPGDRGELTITIGYPEDF